MFLIDIENLVFDFLFRCNQIDKHLRVKVLQRIINGELKDGCLFHYDETFNVHVRKVHMRRL